MKSYNHLYEKTISETNRRYALSQAKHSKRFRKIMKHRHMSDDAAVEQSLDWIVNYENAEHVPVYIYDGITRKERTIIVPTIEELLVQHCIVNAMKPMFCKGMYEHMAENAIKGTNDSDNIVQIMAGQETGDSQQLAIMEAIADLYDAVAAMIPE